MLGNLAGHERAADVPLEALHEIDRYMLCRLTDFMGWCGVIW